MGCVDCGDNNNWDNCDALEIEKGTNRLPKKLIIQSQAEVAPNGRKKSEQGAVHRATSYHFFIAPTKQKKQRRLHDRRPRQLRLNAAFCLIQTESGTVTLPVGTTSLTAKTVSITGANLCVGELRALKQQVAQRLRLRVTFVALKTH